MRKPLLLALWLGTTTAACTTLLGDFTVSGTKTDSGLTDTGVAGDTGAPGEGGSPEGGSCAAVTSNVAVYVGLKATLDGLKSTTSNGDNIQYSWAVDHAPMGSAITTANLAGASTATASFVPDLPGTYSLVLTIVAGDCMTSAPATVSADLPQVLYAQGTVTGSGPQATYVVADLTEGGPPHPVMCPDTAITQVTNEIATFASNAGRAYDFWEAPAGQPSSYAAFTVDYQAGNYTTHLWAGTTASGCDASPPMNLGASGFGPSPFGSEPHFSPDGSRFAVYDAQWHVLTYAANGSSEHTVASYTAGQMGAPSFDVQGRGSSYTEPPRIAWVPPASGPATTVAWARSNSSTGGWEIVTATDQTNSTPGLYMSCAGVTPREIAMLADGSVIVSYRATPTSGENIFQLMPGGSSPSCQVKHQYTHVSDAAAAIATDFDVSPGPTNPTLAFLQLDPTQQDASLWSLAPDNQYPGGYVFVVPVNQSMPPTQVSPTPALFGPRWIGGGTLLVFTGLVATPDAQPPKTSVGVVAPNGTGQRVVAQGDGVTTFVSTSGSGACAGVTGRVGPVGAALVALGAFAALLRGRGRRRRR